MTQSNIFQFNGSREAQARLAGIARRFIDEMKNAKMFASRSNPGIVSVMSSESCWVVISEICIHMYFDAAMDVI